MSGAPMLSAGNNPGTLTANCVMEHVALEYLRARGVVTTADLLRLKTDAPGCTAPWIISAAQQVNDQLDDVERQRLAVLIPRLLQDARTPADPVLRKRVAVRVACWAARSVVHLAADQARTLRAIETAEAWLRGEASEKECRDAARDADTAAYAAYAAYAAARAYAAAYAAAAAAAAAADAELDAVLWLDGLLDAHVKALAEEGLLGDEDAFEVWAVESCPCGENPQ